jgi:hypothetical protein
MRMIAGLLARGWGFEFFTALREVGFVPNGVLDKR